MPRGARIASLVGITLLLEGALWAGPVLVILGRAAPVADARVLFGVSAAAALLGLAAGFLRRLRRTGRILAYLGLLGIHASLLLPLADRSLPLGAALVTAPAWIAFSAWATDVIGD